MEDRYQPEVVGLSREDLTAALRFIGRVQAAADVDTYRQALLSGALELIDGNIASYNEIDFAGGHLFTLTEPAIDPETIPVFNRYKDQNPLVAHHEASGDPGPTAISDLISAEEFRATEIYGRFYSLYGIEDQIAMRLPSPPGSAIAIVVNRTSWGFSAREHRLLTLVRPHALQSFRTVQTIAASRAQIAELSARLGAAEPPAIAATARRAELTERQREVLALLASGASTDAIASELGISRGTVLKHVENIRQALGVHNRVELLAALLASRAEHERASGEG